MKLSFDVQSYRFDVRCCPLDLSPVTSSMEHLPCTFCLGSRALLLGAGAVKPRERLAPAPLTCPRCRAPSYCSYECGQMAAQMHDALCFDASASDGAAIARRSLR